MVCLLIYITASYKTAKEREEWHHEIAHYYKYESMGTSFAKGNKSWGQLMVALNITITTGPYQKEKRKEGDESLIFETTTPRDHLNSNIS